MYIETLTHGDDLDGNKGTEINQFIIEGSDREQIVSQIAEQVLENGEVGVYYEVSLIDTVDEHHHDVEVQGYELENYTKDISSKVLELLGFKNA